MADYHYVPKEKPRQYGGGSSPDYVGDFFKENKRAIKVTAGVLIALVLLYFVGPSITGNLFLSEQDRQLASSSDFPDLSQFEANKQYYLCSNDLRFIKQQKSGLDAELSTTSMSLNACLSEKTQATNELSSTKTSLDTCNASLIACEDDKEEVQNHLDLAEAERDQFKDDIDELEEDYYKLAENFAKLKCPCEKEEDEWIYVSYKVNRAKNKIYCHDEDHRKDDDFDLNCE